MSIWKELTRSASVLLVVWLAGLVLAPAGAQGGEDAAAAGPADPALTSFAATEFAVFGLEASLRWAGTSSEGKAIGGVTKEPAGGTGGDFGCKLKAGLLSLVVPGAGQFYNGDRTKAYVFGAAEVGVWTSIVVFHIQAKNREETYQDFARLFAGVDGKHDEAYWLAVQGYMNTDRYNEAVAREARTLGEEPVGLIGPEHAWQWSTWDHFYEFNDLRADARRNYDHRNFMTLFLILNRAVAVYDAVRNAHREEPAPDHELLGFNVSLAVSAAANDPRAECVFRRSF